MGSAQRRGGERNPSGEGSQQEVLRQGGDGGAPARWGVVGAGLWALDRGLGLGGPPAVTALTANDRFGLLLRPACPVTPQRPDRTPQGQTDGHTQPRTC